MSRPLERLIYRSKGVGDVSSALNDILATAVWANARHQITGVLAAVHGHYLQVLEGPKGELESLLGCLLRDRRHTDLAVLQREPTDTRLLPGWSMARVDLDDLDEDALDDGPYLTQRLVQLFWDGETRVA